MAEGVPSSAVTEREQEAGRAGLNTVVLTFARLFGAAIAVYQVSLINPALGVENVGQFRTAFSYCAMFTVFASMGVHRVLFRDIAKDPTQAWPLVWSASALMLIQSVLTYGALLLVFMFIDGDSARTWAVAGAGLWVVVLWALQQPFEYMLMARERMVTASVLNIFIACLKVVGIFVFIHDDATSFEAHGLLALCTFAGLLVFIAVTLVMERGEFPRVRIVAMRGLFEASFPMSCMILFSMIYFHADLVILARIQGDAASGIYGQVRQITDPVLMLAGAMGSALFPMLCRHAASPDTQSAALRQSVLRLTLLVALPIAAGIAATALPIVQLLSREEFEAFRPSVGVLQAACIAAPLFYFNGVAMEMFLANHQHWYIVKVYGLAAGLSIVLNTAAAYYVGVYGVVMTAITVNAVITIFFAVRLRNELGGLRLASFLPRIVLATAVMGALAWFVTDYSFVLAVLAGAVVYSGLVLLLNPFDEREWRLLSSVAHRVRRRGAV